MYTIFTNGKPIFLTDSLISRENYLTKNFQDVTIEEIIFRLQNENISGVYLYHESLDFLWTSFKNTFKVEDAAGGLVYNILKEILFIYRYDTWDLPKGRVEKGESIEEAAVREVQEECGVDHLEIKKQLQETYHLFYRDNTCILKRTYWYLMYTEFNGLLVPQVEEFIEKAAFLNEIQTHEAMQNTFDNIQQLIQKNTPIKD